MGGIAILGSTGSIGTQAVETCVRFSDRFRVAALSTHRNIDLLARQVDLLGPAVVVIADAQAAARAGSPRVLGGATVFTGPDAVVALASGELVGCDTVLNSLVGVAGLRATMAALQSGKRLALANKESLVVGGDLVMDLVGTAGSELIPVDSEHSAVFQCLVGEEAGELARIVLTASGGPFKGRTRAELEAVTREQALQHPKWSMGPKITIDSATLMNKGLEVIEAHHLFGVEYDCVDVVIHPQSIVHSMVEFVDGSIKAHLGRTDMRIPIQYALSYPERLEGSLPRLDLVETASLTFEAPDSRTFAALPLAYAAGRAGGTAPAVLNAANEEAVAAFLDGHCTFLDIADTVASAVEAHEAQPADSIEALFEADAWARELVRKRITWKS